VPGSSPPPNDASVETKKLKEKGIILPAEHAKPSSKKVPKPIRMVDEVADVVHNAGLARKVARVRSMGSSTSPDSLSKRNLLNGARA
jgi:RNA-splicing ligase RtcB